MTALGLCGCGCGQPTRINHKDEPSKGWIKGEHRRFVKGHQNKRNDPLYLVNPATGCWEWNRYRDPQGYGRVHTDNGHPLAHRVFYERAHGPIPDGLQLDHLCRNHACVNPEHLEPVTNAENSRRGLRTKLTRSDVAAILSSSETCASLAIRYGVTAQYVGQLRNGKKWVAA